MNGPTHEMFGAAAGLGVATAAGLSPVDAGLVTVGAWAAARLPDVFEMTFPRPVQRVLKRRAVFAHRKQTHCLLALAGWTAVCVTLGVSAPLLLWANVGLAVGYVSHLVADAMTVSGIPVLWPMSSRDVWVLPEGLRMRTNRRVGDTVGIMLLAAMIGVNVLVMTS